MKRPDAPANGMRAAINAKCKDCIYDSCAPGNWRQQVHACHIKSCSLWPYRPLSESPLEAKHGNREEQAV